LNLKYYHTIDLLDNYYYGNFYFFDCYFCNKIDFFKKTLYNEIINRNDVSISDLSIFFTKLDNFRYPNDIYEIILRSTLFISSVQPNL